MVDKAETKFPLGKFKGKPILGTSIIVNKLGAGLTKSVGIDPVVIEPGVQVFLAVRVTLTKYRYDVVKNEATGGIDGYELVQVFDATGAVFADGDVVGADIQTMVDRIIAEEALQKGQLSLEIPDGPAERVKRKENSDIANKVDDVFRDDDKKKGK